MNVIDKLAAAGAKCFLRGDRLVVTGTIEPAVKTWIAEHRAQIRDTLLGREVDWTIGYAHKQLRHLGLVMLENGRYTHSEGDDKMNEILFGAITFEQAEAEVADRKRRSREMRHARIFKG